MKKALEEMREVDRLNREAKRKIKRKDKAEIIADKIMDYVGDWFDGYYMSNGGWEKIEKRIAEIVREELKKR
jgi:hypothetical protein